MDYLIPAWVCNIAVKKIYFELQIEINCLKSAEEDLRNPHKVTIIVNINEYKLDSGLIFLFSLLKLFVVLAQTFYFILLWEQSWGG